jgi:FkbH-like protein
MGAIRQFVAPTDGTSPAGSLIVGTLPPPISPTYAGDRGAIDELRLLWSQELAKLPGVQLLDFSAAIERIGLAAAGDVAMELATRAPYSTAAFRELGIEIARLVRNRRRPPAKVLALDCDNTLWGGVLGEEGFDGILIGDDGPGRSFQAFQRSLLRLKQQGVLLVLVSRNEEADVLDVFDRHPGMILRRKDIAAWRINWQHKAANLQELAAELNLGLDAFVFVDDDSAQRLHVESLLPAVHVFPLPAEPAHYASTLQKAWIFDSPSLTAEDLARTDMIRQERDRQQQLASAGSMDAYLHSLELQVELREAEHYDFPRVAQLTQKTNQFNLSLRRRSLDEIKALGNDYRTFVLAARDRFGDYGQIGVCILRHDSGASHHLEIDTYLVSCRALGRGVEDTLLHAVFSIARRLECRQVIAPFVDGPRNQPAHEFFSRSGFHKSDTGQYVADVSFDRPLPSHAQLQFDFRQPLAT